MKNSFLRFAACLLITLPTVLPACENEKTAESTTGATTAPGAHTSTSQPVASSLASAAEPAAATPPTPPQYELPVPADFDEESEKTITKANYKAELAALEGEIK